MGHSNFSIEFANRPRWFIRQIAVSVCAVLTLSTPAHAEGLPELGDTSQGGFSPQMERRVGEQIFNEIRTREPSYVSDPEVNSYLNRIGTRIGALTDNASDPISAQAFNFFALRDPTLNAFAMPGGYIGVHTGLLLSAQTESELASVLAHEISHVTQHHIARSFSSSGLSQMAMLLSLAVAILAARSNPDVAMGAAIAGQAAGIQSRLNYSRDFEREADRIGLQLLDRAEFDARAMPVFFNRMLKYGSLYENNAPAYLRTHPLTTERISAIEDRIEGRIFRHVPDSIEFHLVRAKLRAAQLTAREAITDFESKLRDPLPLQVFVARYGLVRAYLAEGNIAPAQFQWHELSKLQQQQKIASPMLDTLAAELSLRAGDPQAAVRQLVSSHAHYPHDRAINYLLVEAQLAAGNYALALEATRSDLQNFPDDPQAHALQAKSYALLGQHAQQHRAQAESYVLLGLLPQAIEQLELAQRVNDGNFYDQSQVDAKLRDLRQRQLELLKARRGNASPG